VFWPDIQLQKCQWKRKARKDAHRLLAASRVTVDGFGRRSSYVPTVRSPFRPSRLGSNTSVRRVLHHLLHRERVQIHHTPQLLCNMIYVSSPWH
jgi:hypothetical protein